MEHNSTLSAEPLSDSTGQEYGKSSCAASSVQNHSETYLDGNAFAAKALAKAGIEYMFGVVGIPVTSFATCALKEGIRFIAFHNEQSAGYAAGAAAYLTGKPGVLLTVSGPGCVHGLAGLSNAMINTWPVILISGSSTQTDTGKGDFQELDQVEAVKPFSKYSGKARNIFEIPLVISKAITFAVHGRPGGTYVDLPTDVLHETISVTEGEKLLSDLQPYVPSWSKVETSVGQQLPNLEIDAAVSLLQEAERPLIVLGKGAAYARAEDPIRQLVQLTGIPFLPTPMGKGIIPDTHQRSAVAARSLALKESDVVLVVGARLNWLLHYGAHPNWSKDVKFILIDISSEEIALRKPAIGLVGDARRLVSQINKKIKDTPFSLGDKHPWVEKLQKKTEDNVKRMAASLNKDVVPFNFLTPMRIIRDAMADLGLPAPILVSEGANTMDVGRSVLQQIEPRTRLDAGTWGTMGVGLGYAIAAAVVSPERLVVAVEGDSGFGFSGLEVETIVRYKLPVIVIVFNNDGIYGGDRRSPEDIEGPLKDFPAPTSFVPCARYDIVMEAFGGKGYFATTPQELQSAVKEAFALRQPALINIRIDPYAGSESGRMQHKN
ncbi:hypothetical protein O6H91_10G091800 [Diphasiastrum complanatum]|uniref:Uncharacterized protein n=1 Tax=Diphasiastrum complanatum TaxID=34168 RepID=A0ACC2CJJ4_DIPCM|nr:hypothetical protein O6H91_10G091800 [Diphasiastrum complanatum]